MTTQKRHQNFDYTTIADRLRTVSWGNDKVKVIVCNILKYMFGSQIDCFYGVFSIFQIHEAYMYIYIAYLHVNYTMQSSKLTLLGPKKKNGFGLRIPVMP